MDLHFYLKTGPELAHLILAEMKIVFMEHKKKMEIGITSIVLVL